MIDFYCERAGPGLFAEPLNALSNLSFLIAARRAWILGRNPHLLTAGIRLLTILVVCVGIGSALYHTFATGWARLLDVIPILLFQLCYLWLYLRKVAGMSVGPALLSILGYCALLYYVLGFSQLLNGSLMYAPALVVLLGLALFHYLHVKSGNILLFAVGIFTLSLIFRTVDRAICTLVPSGTHFLWHLLNGVVLYLSLRALVLGKSDSATS